MRKKLFEVLDVYRLVVTVEGYEIEQISFADDLVRLSCDDEYEWHFVDQDIEIDDDGGATILTYSDEDTDGDPEEVTICFEINDRRPINDCDFIQEVR